MRIEISGGLPKENDVDGVPAEFLAPPPKCEFVQLDYKSAKVETFESQYRQFHADLYRFHEKYSKAETLDDFTNLSIDIGVLGEKYPDCRDLIVEVFNMIERDYIKRGEK